MKQLSSHVVRTSDVIGKKVIGKDNESLGKIEEIVLEKVGGKVRYAVLSFGGFLGMGTDLYALPWKTLRYSAEEDAFEVKVDKEKLKSASGFNKDNWPDFADATWGKSINDFYNHYIDPESPSSQEQVEFISEGGNSQPLYKHFK